MCRGGDNESLFKDNEGDCHLVRCVADRFDCLDEGSVALGLDLELEELRERFWIGNCFRPM